MRILAVIWGSWRLYEDHGGYIVDPGGYMRILAVIRSRVGSRDTLKRYKERKKSPWTFPPAPPLQQLQCGSPPPRSTEKRELLY